MLKPVAPPPTICPLCGEPGVHGVTAQCIEALKAAIKKAREAVKPIVEPSIKFLGRWEPSFVP